MLNLADLLSSTPNPIGMVNSVWYCARVTSNRDNMADLSQYIKASNTFLAVENGELIYTMRSTDNLALETLWQDSGSI